MNFLEAHSIVRAFEGGAPLDFLFAISGTPDKLLLFLKAAGARRGRSVSVATLPFNTLGQKALEPSAPSGREVFLLFPWDLVPEGDWRSGFATAPPDVAAIHARAETLVGRLSRRTGACLLYVPAPLASLFPHPDATAGLEAWLLALMGGAGADILRPDVFSLASYLANGSPFAGTQLGLVAEAVVRRAIGEATEPRKVLVTDLDNVMWRGVIGEDGLDGIQFSPEGAGFKHFVYQTFLAKLKREGALLAAVSRNDPELANGPIASRRMTLRPEDFVVVVASYNAKSAQIRQIAAQLNLGLDAFVFVDDNPIELEEVSAALPGIKAERFPESEEDLLGFFDRVGRLFPRSTVTAEDRDRTEMYRRRLEGMVPTDAAGADLTSFLRGLEMHLVIRDRSKGDRTRAVQLINKTNQFNVNGLRVTDEEVGTILSRGGRLLTASLTDRTGSHGEILACLIDGDRTVRSLVMSCRVFQRRVEHAFFVWLAAQEDPPRQLLFAATPRNEPVQQFLQDPSFGPLRDGLVAAELTRFAQEMADAADLFVLEASAELAR